LWGEKPAVTSLLSLRHKEKERAYSFFAREKETDSSTVITLKKGKKRDGDCGSFIVTIHRLLREEVCPVAFLRERRRALGSFPREFQENDNVWGRETVPSRRSKSTALFERREEERERKGGSEALFPAPRRGERIYLLPGRRKGETLPSPFA